MFFLIIFKCMILSNLNQISQFKYSVSCDLSAISVGTGTSRHQSAPVATGTDRHRPVATGTDRHRPVATGTDRHKIARDEFY